jgi:predicted Rossmann-fold nucleotide-binding protein
MERICVYCGSSPGAQPEYIQAARQLSRALAGRNIGLVYGGASVGVMGEIAKTVLEANEPPKIDKASLALQHKTTMRQC